MVYKKYIKRNGKLYGPYVYHSKRVDGKVVSEYIGPKSSFNKNYFFGAAAVLFLVLVLASGIYFFNESRKSFSGQAVINLEGNYVYQESFDGDVKINLKEGELIPAQSEVVLENGGESYYYNLSDFVEDETVSGSFYIQGKSLSGEGEGYGLEGEKEITPQVYFKLRIVEDEIVPSDDSEEIESNESEDNIIEVEQNESESEVVEEGVEQDESEVVEEETVEVEEATVEEDVEDNSEEEINDAGVEVDEQITGNIISRLFGGVYNFFLNLGPSGQVVLGDEVEGSVTKGDEYSLMLPDGQAAEIVSGSVRTAEENLSDGQISLDRRENEFIVTTTYSETESGFGSEYIGEKEKTINLNLSSKNLIFDEEILNVKLVYGGEEILSLSVNLSEGVIYSENKTESNLTMTNATVTELTGEERAILQNEFGNESVRVTKAEEFNGRIVVRMEVGNYWTENSYGSDLTDEKLEEQISESRTRWLKDLANNLLKEETVPQNRSELFVNYSI